MNSARGTHKDDDASVAGAGAGDATGGQRDVDFSTHLSSTAGGADSTSLIQAFFALIHVLNEQRNKAATRAKGEGNVGSLPMAQLIPVALLVLDALAIMQLLVVDSFGWPEEMANARFSLFVWVNPPDDERAYYATLAAVHIVLWLTLVGAAYVAWSFKRGVFITILPALGLRLVMGSVVTFIFVPALDVLLLPLRCDTLAHHVHSYVYMAAKVGAAPCTDAVGVVLAVTSALAITAFAPFTMATQLLYYDASVVSYDWLACRSGHDSVADTAVRTIVTLLAFFASDSQPVLVAIVFLLTQLGLALTTAYTLPYHHVYMNCFRAALYMSSAWIALGSIVLASGAVQNSYTAGVIIFSTVPIAAALGLALPLLRRAQLMRLLTVVLPIARDAANRAEAEALSPVSSARAPTVPDIEAHRSMTASPPVAILAGYRDASASQVALAMLGITGDLMQMLAVLCVRTPANRSRLCMSPLVFDRAALQDADALYAAGVDTFPTSGQLRVAHARFIAGAWGDMARAAVALSSVAHCHPRMDESFAVFSFGRALEQQRQAQELGDARGVDGLGLAAFQQTLAAALRNHQEAVERLAAMWKLLATRGSTATQVELTSAVGEVVVARDKAARAYASIMKSYPNSIRVLRTVAAFQRDVCNDMPAAAILLDRAELLGNPDAEAKTDPNSWRGQNSLMRSSGGGARGSVAGSMRSAGNGSGGASSSGASSAASRRAARDAAIANRGQRAVDSMSLYVSIGLALLAGIAAATFAAGNVGLQQFSTSAAAVNIAGQRRALTMRTALLAREVALTASIDSGNAAQLGTTRTLLLSSLGTMSSIMNQLHAPSALFPAVAALYDTPSFISRTYIPSQQAWTNTSVGLHEFGVTYMANAVQVAQTPTDLTTPAAAASHAPLRYVLANAEALFSGFMTCTVLYTDQAKYLASSFITIEAVLLAVDVIVVLLLWTCIFWPSLVRVQTNNAVIVRMARATPAHAAKRMAWMFTRLDNKLDAETAQLAGDDGASEGHSDRDEEDGEDHDDRSPLAVPNKDHDDDDVTPVGGAVSMDFASQHSMVVPSQGQPATDAANGEASTSGANGAVVTRRHPIRRASKQHDTDTTGHRSLPIESQAPGVGGRDNRHAPAVDDSGATSPVLLSHPRDSSGSHLLQPDDDDDDSIPASEPGGTGVDPGTSAYSVIAHPYLPSASADLSTVNGSDVVHVAARVRVAPRAAVDLTAAGSAASARLAPPLGIETKHAALEKVATVTNHAGSLITSGKRVSMSAEQNDIGGAPHAALPSDSPPASIRASIASTAAAAAGAQAAIGVSDDRSWRLARRASAGTQRPSHARGRGASSSHSGKGGADATPAATGDVATGVSRAKRQLQRGMQACRAQLDVNKVLKAPLARKMVMQMGAAFLIVVAMQATAFVVTRTAITAAVSRTLSVNYAGLQRALTQRTALYAREAAIADDMVAPQSVLVNTLRQTTVDFGTNLRGIMYGDASLGLDSVLGLSSSLDNLFLGGATTAFVPANISTVAQLASQEAAMATFGIQGLATFTLAAAQGILTQFGDGTRTTGANYTAILSIPQFVLLRDMERAPGLLFASLANAVVLLVDAIAGINSNAANGLVTVLVVQLVVLLIVYVAISRGVVLRLRDEAARTDEFKALLPAQLVASTPKLRAVIEAP